MGVYKIGDKNVYGGKLLQVHQIHNFESLKVLLLCCFYNWEAGLIYSMWSSCNVCNTWN